MEDADEVQRKQRKLLYLESLRGLAAVVVIFSHFANTFFPAAAVDPGAPTHSALEVWLHNTPLGIFLAGNFAVCLFFVMSGYVLVRPYFLTKRQDVLLSATYRRYARLMPPVAISVLAAFVLLKLGLFTNQAAAVVTHSQWLAGQWHFRPSLHVALYQAFVGAFVNRQVSYNPLLWTMTTEFMGSLLIFAIAALVGLHSKRWLVYGLLAVLFARTYYLGFIVGLAMADYFSHPGAASRFRVKERYLILVVLAGLVLGAYPSDGFASVTLYHGFVLPKFDPTQLISFWHTLAAAMVVGTLLVWTRAKSILSNKVLVRLGKMSFSLYLTHLIILCTLGTGLFSLFRGHFGYIPSFWLTLAPTGVFIFAISYFYTEYVDAFAIRRSREFGAWMMSDVWKWPEWALRAPGMLGDLRTLRVGRQWKGLRGEAGRIKLRLPWR